MSEGFIRTRSGALNLRHVRRIYEEKTLEGFTVHTAVTDEGTEYAVDLGNEALDQLCQRLIPASHDDRACLLAVNPGDLTVGGVWEQHVKIVAWGISVNYGGGCYGAEPIFTEKPASNQVPLLRCPDGTWLLQEDASYATLEEAKAAILDEYKTCHPTTENQIAGDPT
jgi:hypothetical protein